MKNEMRMVYAEPLKESIKKALGAASFPHLMAVIVGQIDKAPTANPNVSNTKGDDFMKIELNPERMTMSELNDCIAELIAQRDRILEENRKAIEQEVNLNFMDAWAKAQDYAKHYEMELNVTLTRGRSYRIPLDAKAIKEWCINVTARATNDEAEV